MIELVALYSGFFFKLVDQFRFLLRKSTFQLLIWLILRSNYKCHGLNSYHRNLNRGL